MEAITSLSDFFRIDDKDIFAPERHLLEQRFQALWDNPQAQEDFLRDLPFLDAEPLARFVEWDRGQTYGMVWTWDYGNAFEEKLSRKLWETLMGPMGNPEARRLMVKDFMVHWGNLTDAQLEPLVAAWSADPELKGWSDQLRRDMRVRQAEKEPEP
jgi:hypothetical protein